MQNVDNSTMWTIEGDRRSHEDPGGGYRNGDIRYEAQLEKEGAMSNLINPVNTQNFINFPIIKMPAMKKTIYSSFFLNKH